MFLKDQQYNLSPDKREMIIIPRQLVIETINGICSARCIMCSYKTWTRKKNRMTAETFKKILQKFNPYQDHIEHITLHAAGEPLLDKSLPEKVKTCNDMGFRGIGFSTNCMHLDEKKSKALIDAGLNTIICSIDGISPDTHESIRVRTNFDQCVSNVKRFIELRNQSGNTRVMIRFIRQKLNHHEWPAFEQFWTEQLNADFNDTVQKYDVHNWGSSVKDLIEENVTDHDSKPVYICNDIFDNMKIFSNGHVSFCCVDDNGFHNLRNVLDKDPLEIFNNGIYTRYREMMKKGLLAELETCKKCSVPRSRSLKKNEN